MPLCSALVDIIKRFSMVVCTLQPAQNESSSCATASLALGITHCSLISTLITLLKLTLPDKSGSFHPYVTCPFCPVDDLDYPSLKLSILLDSVIPVSYFFPTSTLVTPSHCTSQLFFLSPFLKCVPQSFGFSFFPFTLLYAPWVIFIYFHGFFYHLCG